MFSYRYIETNIALVLQQCVAGFPVNEQYLQGDDVDIFKRELNKARNKEKSKAFKAKCDKGVMVHGRLVRQVYENYF